MEQITASAPAKIILFGEHSVVYGYPAIATAINLRAFVTASSSQNDFRISSTQLPSVYKVPFMNSFSDDKVPPQVKPIIYAILVTQDYLDKHTPLKIHINSQIPMGAGLGSSAAVNVATVAAVSNYYGASLDKSTISELAFEAEKIVHGTPSGIDNTIATFGGLIYYQKGKIEQIKSTKEFSLVIGNTLISRQTKVLVAKVRSLKELLPSVVVKIFSSIGDIVELAREELITGNIEKLGHLININHGLLESIGVSHRKLSELVHAALSAGALGAKLTGAGGGGCMFALVRKENLSHVADAIKKAGGAPIITSTTLDGVLVHG